ncbi:MAG: nucleotidyl transferase AbiEii/AbiGii toxin family protein [Dermatophilaceae bacterium]
MTARSHRMQSVNDRIRLAAAERGVDANRLRRALVFQRMLVRLAPHGLILKGGFCLEARLADRARATRDIDLVGRLAKTDDAGDLRDSLEGLLDDGLDDAFGFRVARPRPLRGEDAATNAWRSTVMATIAEADFETVTLDLVGQVDEVAGGTETLSVPPPVAIPGLDPVRVEAVDVFQHAAEKYHAYGRIYAENRPSSRVKDLVDLVLLADAGLLADHRRLGQRLAVVHHMRDHGPPPTVLPEPPASWRESYAAFAADLGLSATTVDAAHALAAELHSAALTEGLHP